MTRNKEKSVKWENLGSQMYYKDLIYNLEDFAMLVLKVVYEIETNAKLFL